MEAALLPLFFLRHLKTSIVIFFISNDINSNPNHLFLRLTLINILMKQPLDNKFLKKNIQKNELFIM